MHYIRPAGIPTAPVPNILVAARASMILAKGGNGVLTHSRRVAELVGHMLECEPRLGGGLSRETVVLAAFLHDLGKSAWAGDLFTAPLHGLGQAARDAMRAHPLIGADLAASLGVTPDVRVLIEQHHERAGGGGYPRNLADPHPAALLIGACDAFCACLEPRPYRREPLPVYEALREAAKVGAPEVVGLLGDFSHGQWLYECLGLKTNS